MTSTPCGRARPDGVRTMEIETEILLRLAVALAIGLLIGMERGWKEWDEKEGPYIAGLRTFGLIGLLGALWELLAGELGPVLLGFGFLGFAGMLIAAGWLAARESRHYGVTTEVAALITFGLGALAMRGHLVPAASAAVVTAIILSVKPVLQRWIELLQRNEVYAVLQLLLISVVLLPILPNRGYGPWEVLNPYEIWWIVVLICGLSFVAYFAQKIAGAQRGVLLTSLFGGMVSSTATTLSFSRQARAEPRLAILYAVGVVVACTAMFPRILLIVGAIRPELVRLVAWPLGAMAVLSGLSALWQWRTLKASKDLSAPTLNNPFEIKMALQFAGLLTVVMLLAEALRHWFGDAGVYLVAGFSGLADVDAISVSLSRMTPEQLGLAVAAAAITIAAIVNTVVKTVLAATLGGPVMARRVGITNLAVLLCGAAVLWATR